MFCPNCGKQNLDEAAFCFSCGTDLKAVVLGQATTEKQKTGVITPNVIAAQEILEKQEAPIQLEAQLETEFTVPEAPKVPVSSGARTLDNNRYKIIRELGSGGMGKVYLARDEKMEFDVVIKEMLPLMATPRERQYIEKHFKQEAKMLYRLKHAGLPRVTDYIIEGSSIYIIMEYINGEDLESIVKNRPENRVGVQEFFLWLGKVLNILRYLHNQDPPIIHRDIKPGNIMIKDGTEVFLVDFGVARTIGVRSGTQTRVGTPGFASPEHFFGKFILSSDIFSLGATFHYLMTGDDPRTRNPFDYPPLSQYRNDIPPGVQSILDRMLEVEKDRRYQRIEDVENDLSILSRKLASQGIISQTVNLDQETIAIMEDTQNLESKAPVTGGGFSYGWTKEDEIIFEGPVCSCAYSPDGETIAVGTGNSELISINAETTEFLYTSVGHTDWIRSLVFSPNGRNIMTASDDNKITIWDSIKGKNLRVLPGHEDWVRSLSISTDGNILVSGSYDTKIKVWSTRAWNVLTDIDQLEEAVNSVAISPDGTMVASGCDDARTYLWDTKKGTMLKVFEGHDSYVYAVAFSPDGKYLATGAGDNMIKIWDVESGANLLTLEGHEKQIFSIAYSPDGQRLVSGSDDMTVRVWQVASGSCEAVLEGHEYAVYSVAFSPDGTRILSGSGDKALYIWKRA